MKVLLAAASLLVATSAFAAESSCESMIKDIPGTYNLVKRTLTDGTVLSGKNVQGTTIFTNDGRRVTAVAINSGKNKFSASVQTEYSFSSTKFSDALNALVLQEGSAPTVYKFNHPKTSVPIVCDNGKLIIKNPPDDPLSTMTFTKNGMTAVLNKGGDSGSVDVWEKVG